MLLKPGSLLSKDNIVEILVNLGYIQDNLFFYKLTKKGNLFLKEPNLSFNDVITVPQYNSIDTRSKVNLKTRISKNYEIPTPLICSNMECVINADYAIKLWEYGIASALHRFYPNDELYIEEVKKVSQAGVLPIVSCGVKEEHIKLMRDCVAAGAKIIIIDVAHGHSEQVKQMAIAIRQEFSNTVDIIAGNICTAEAVHFLAPYVDGIKSGIGNGAMCKTQVQTGSGGGQITTVLETAEAANTYNLPVISDGGISSAGDIVKVLVAGASAVMAGKIFVQCPESAGEIIEEKDKKYKLYYGMASHILKNKIYGDSKKHVASEGIAVKYPIGPSINEYAPELLAAIKSGYTYCGASNIEELWRYGELRQVSEDSHSKGHPHGALEKDTSKISD